MEGKEQVIVNLESYLKLKDDIVILENYSKKLEKDNKELLISKHDREEHIKHVSFLVSLALRHIPDELKTLALHEGIDLTIIEQDTGKLPTFDINTQNFEEVQRIKEMALNFEPIYEDGFQQANDTEGQQPSESREQGDKEDQTQEDQVPDFED